MALSNGMARGTIDEETLNPLDGGLLESEERWDSEVGNTTTFADFDLVSASCSSRRAHRTETTLYHHRADRPARAGCQPRSPDVAALLRPPPGWEGRNGDVRLSADAPTLRVGRGTCGIPSDKSSCPLALAHAHRLEAGRAVAADARDRGRRAGRRMGGEGSNPQDCEEVRALTSSTPRPHIHLTSLRWCTGESKFSRSH